MRMNLNLEKHLVESTLQTTGIQMYITDNENDRLSNEGMSNNDLLR